MATNRVVVFRGEVSVDVGVFHGDVGETEDLSLFDSV